MLKIQWDMCSFGLLNVESVGLFDGLWSCIVGKGC